MRREEIKRKLKENNKSDIDYLGIYRRKGLRWKRILWRKILECYARRKLRIIQKELKGQKKNISY